MIVECVPNFSEGRDPTTVEAIYRAIASAGGVTILKSELDPDHHRCVITFAGPPEPVLEGAFRGIREARERIDLRAHQGIHPRIGAADVIPLVPVDGITLEECAVLARRLGARVWEELGVPVYFYEAAARESTRTRLEQVRKGGFETPQLVPDLGGPALHPTAGACVVGARKFLIAFNVNLQTSDVEVAKTIARRIRESSGGMPHVKALGLFLRSRNLAQVSMNLTDYEQTPLHTVFERVREEAAALGVAVAESELIGLAPQKAIEQAAAHFLRLGHFRPDQIFENRLRSADREIR